MRRVQELDLYFSESRMKDKKSSRTPPEATVISGNIKIFLQRIRENDKILSNKSVNWTPNVTDDDLHYIPHSMLKLKRNKAKYPPLTCKLFDSVT